LRSWKRRKGHIQQPLEGRIGSDVVERVSGPVGAQEQPPGTWMQDPDGGWHFIR
jgi:hypothetical protein